MSELGLIIGKNIKFYRESKELFQKSLAEVIGTTLQTISNYETGRTNLSSDMVSKFAVALGVSESALVYTGETPKPLVVKQELGLADAAKFVLAGVKNLESQIKKAVAESNLPAGEHSLGQKTLNKNEKVFWVNRGECQDANTAIKVNEWYSSFEEIQMREWTGAAEFLKVTIASQPVVYCDQGEEVSDESRS